jgi:hypothetical protein
LSVVSPAGVVADYLLGGNATPYENANQLTGKAKVQYAEAFEYLYKVHMLLI